MPVAGRPRRRRPGWRRAPRAPPRRRPCRPAGCGWRRRSRGPPRGAARSRSHASCAGRSRPREPPARFAGVEHDHAHARPEVDGVVERRAPRRGAQRGRRGAPAGQPREQLGRPQRPPARVGRHPQRPARRARGEQPVDRRGAVHAAGAARAPVEPHDHAACRWPARRSGASGGTSPCTSTSWLPIAGNHGASQARRGERALGGPQQARVARRVEVRAVEERVGVARLLHAVVAAARRCRDRRARRRAPRAPGRARPPPPSRRCRR